MAGGVATRKVGGKRKSRALRGFKGGGPTRTRTVDQRIMSPSKSSDRTGKALLYQSFREYCPPLSDTVPALCGRYVDTQNCTDCTTHQILSQRAIDAHPLGPAQLLGCACPFTTR